MNEIPVETTAIRPRLLLVCYTCSPYYGSEPGAGWNRAVQAAKVCDTWVICEGHEFSRDIERYLAEHGPIAGLTFVFVNKTNWERVLERIPGGYFPAYNLWHRRALQIARKLHRQYDFNLTHQATMCGYREPGYLWTLDIPFVWGPIGGAQNYPWRFLPSAGFTAIVSECFRSVANWIQLRFTARVRRAARRAAVVVAANSTTAEAIARVHGVNVEWISDVGIRRDVASPRRAEPQRPLRVLWSGVLEHRKALHLLLHALAAVKQRAAVELRVLGDGSRQAQWMRLAKKLGVADRIAWFGQIPHAEVDDQYAWADVFAFTSLRDTTGTVVVEALAQGLPVLAFAHQGVGDVVTAECGIKIPVTNAREAIRDFADALVRLASDAELRESLSRGACERAREFLWDQNGQRMEKVYRQALAAATSLPYEVWSGRVYESPRHALDRTLDHETTTTSLSLETR